VGKFGLRYGPTLAADGIADRVLRKSPPEAVAFLPRDGVGRRHLFGAAMGAATAHACRVEAAPAHYTEVRPLSLQAALIRLGVSGHPISEGRKQLASPAAEPQVGAKRHGLRIEDDPDDASSFLAGEAQAHIHVAGVASRWPDLNWMYLSTH
jgi:hypothetical protein